MTAPLWTPSPPLQQARGDWRDEQLEHRPSATGASGEWIRLKQLALEQSWDPDDQASLIYDDVVNPYPEIFEVVSDPDSRAVRFLQPGKFHVRVRVAPADFPTLGFEIAFYQVEWDEEGPYSVPVLGTASDPPNTTVHGMAEISFRAGPKNAADADWDFEVVLLSNPTEGFTLKPGGTYLEIWRVAGDPLFPLGLDNFNAEGA